MLPLRELTGLFDADESTGWGVDLVAASREGFCDVSHVDFREVEPALKVGAYDAEIDVTRTVGSVSGKAGTVPEIRAKDSHRLRSGLLTFVRDDATLDPSDGGGVVR